MLKNYYKKFFVGIIFVILIAGIILYYFKKNTIQNSKVPETKISINKSVLVMPEVKPIKIREPIEGYMYHTITITTTNPTKELTNLIGKDNFKIIQEINRIDMAHIKKGTILIIPNDFSNVQIFSPLPQTLTIASDIPKLIVVSQAVQIFGIYENGTLIYWGSVSTGKKSTPTPSKLYFTNWKGESVISSIDDGWIMPWYFNLDNMEGVSIHEYELPGYPASHACIRLLKVDAQWIYNWADQWTLSDNNQTVLTYGTPVIIFGNYNYNKTAPWKSLVQNPNAASISKDDLEKIVTQYKDTIIKNKNY